MADIVYKPPYVPVSTDIQPVKNQIDYTTFIIKYGVLWTASNTSTTGTGNITIYEVPANKVLIINTAQLFARFNSGSNDDVEIFAKINSVAIRLLVAEFSDNSLPHSYANAIIQYAIPLILEPGTRIYWSMSSSAIQRYALTGYLVPLDLWIREFKI